MNRQLIEKQCIISKRLYELYHQEEDKLLESIQWDNLSNEDAMYLYDTISHHGRTWIRLTRIMQERELFNPMEK